MIYGVDRFHGLIALLMVGRLAPSARRKFQELRLRRLVRHAYETVPYYRRLFDEYDLDPESIRTLDDLPRIPISSKQDLQAAGVSARLSRAFEKVRWFERTTSGSTGEPTVIRCTGWEESLVSLFRARSFWARRWRPWRRSVRLQLTVAGRGTPTWIKLLRRSLLQNEIFIDCLLPPEEIAVKLRHLQPVVLSGLPSILGRIADVLNPGELHRLRVIRVGGETATPEMLAWLRERFGAPVRQGYASHEFGQIAEQCPTSELLHVYEESIILEVLHQDRPAQPGEAGSVVGTALHSLGMPFLRYALGDLVRLGPPQCVCGRRGLTLAAVEGRSADLLQLPGRAPLHVFGLVRQFGDAFRWIAQYQVVQETPHAIRVVIKPRRTPSAEERAELLDRINKALQHRVAVELDLSGAIRREPSGKYRVCRGIHR